MPSLYRSFLFLITSISLSIVSYAQDWEDLNWQEKKHKNDIYVYTAKVKDSPYIAIKTETQIKTSLSALVALVMDAEKSTEWVHRCTFSTIQKQISDTEYYQYFISKPPWPFKKRDFVLHVTISQNKNLHVNIKAKATNDLYPEQKGLVRIKNTQSLWKFIPLDNGAVKVTNYAHVEPKIKIPKWISKGALINTPYKTLRNMRTRLESQASHNSLAFIKEKALQQ